MRDKYFYEVMFDDTSIDVSKEVGLVWSIANSLRGAYTSDKYKDVIIPMVIIRRFECALEATKDAVVAKHKQNPNLPAALLCQVSKYPFYNYCLRSRLRHGCGAAVLFFRSNPTGCIGPIGKTLWQQDPPDYPQLHQQ